MGSKLAVVHVPEGSLKVLVTRKLNNTRSIIIGIGKHHIAGGAEVVFQVL